MATLICRRQNFIALVYLSYACLPNGDLINLIKMGEKSLENDLKNSIINFKQIVLLTDLILDYKLTYEEVQRLVESHLSTAKETYEKSYLVQGLEGKTNSEIFSIVKENEVQAALKKLEQGKSSLYAVELKGGSKSMPQQLKPLSYARIALKDALKDVAEVVVPEEKTEKSMPVKKEEEKKKPDIAVVEKKVTQQKKTPPAKKPLAEKGQIKRPTSPKKLNDFFKKNTKPAQVKKEEANHSMQLFEDDEEEEEDEKAALAAAEQQDKQRRALLDNEAETIDVDDEEEDDDVILNTTANKRRRILDSDDEEEQPQAKQDKKVAEEQQKTASVEPGTYMDEDGFMRTVKKKTQNAIKTPQKKSPKKTPAKTLPKKAAPQSKTATKTKQGNIMSFFTKK